MCRFSKIKIKVLNNSTLLDIRGQHRFNSRDEVTPPPFSSLGILTSAEHWCDLKKVAHVVVALK